MVCNQNKVLDIGFNPYLRMCYFGNGFVDGIDLLRMEWGGQLMDPISAMLAFVKKLQNSWL